MAWEDRKKDFIEWLETEDIESNRIADDKWNVEEDEYGDLVVTSYRTPFIVVIEKKKGREESEEYAIMNLYTGVETTHLRPHEKSFLYRKMLKLHNDYPLLKYCLTKDIGEKPFVRVDLDLNSVSKVEFSHALESALNGMNDFFSSVITKARLKDLLGRDENWDVYHMEKVLMNLVEEIRENKITKDIAIKRLITKFDLEEDEAKERIHYSICENTILDLWGGDVTLEQAIEDTASDLEIEEERADEIIKSFLRFLLIRRINNKSMNQEEAMLWLQDNFGFSRGKSFEFLNQEGDVKDIYEILDEL